MKASVRPSGKTAASGMSLIELMIALVLGLIVTGAAVALFATNRMTYSVAESMGRIQESNHTAFELMSRDMRDAGGTPCDASLANSMVNGLVTPTASWYTNWDNGLRGYDGATAFTTPTGSAGFGTAVKNRVAGTEALEIKSAQATDDVVSADVADANRNQNIPVSNTTGLAAGDLLIVCDYHGGTIFQATGFSGTTGIIHAAGGAAGTNVDGTLDLGSYGNDKFGVAIPAISANGVIANLHATRWYIGCNGRVACTAPGGTSLFEARMYNNAGTTAVAYDEIAAGATNMNLSYLETGGTAYNAAPASWPAVTAIKISLTFASQDKLGTDGNPIRRTFEHVVGLRDHLP